MNTLSVLAYKFLKHRQQLSFERDGDKIVFYLDGERFFRCGVNKKLFLAISRRSFVTTIVHIEAGDSEYSFAVRPWELDRAKPWAIALFKLSSNRESELRLP